MWAAGISKFATPRASRTCGADNGTRREQAKQPSKTAGSRTAMERLRSEARNSVTARVASKVAAPSTRRPAGVVQPAYAIATQPARRPIYPSCAKVQLAEAQLKQVILRIHHIKIRGGRRIGQDDAAGSHTSLAMSIQGQQPVSDGRELAPYHGVRSQMAKCEVPTVIDK
jgi:hypothetical protein